MNCKQITLGKEDSGTKKRCDCETLLGKCKVDQDLVC